MMKKKYYNKNGNQIRSKPKKPFYQMFSFWLVLILSIIIIITVVNFFTGRSVIDDEYTTSNNNINSDKINESVTEEYELNNDYNSDGQELNNDNNASERSNNNNLEKDLLDDYNQLEIDYARIMLMTNVPRIDPIEPFIFVNKHSAGDRIFTAVDSITYPENVTVLWGPNNSYSNHDVSMIAYSAQGDGHITIYPFPTDYEIDIEAETDEDYRILTQQIIENAYSTYIDPSEPHLVAEVIDSVEFIYE